MTRKDTILIAVVINAGLLAMLFTTAVIYDTDKELEQSEFVTPLVDGKRSEEDSKLIAEAHLRREEGHVFQYEPHSTTIEIQPEVFIQESVTLDSSSTPLLVEDKHSVEIKVKKGDTLEKIAKMHKVTVDDLKKVNRLQKEFLSVGQILKIPIKEETITSSEEIKQGQKKEEATDQAVYYVIKKGDSPWKIAKLYGVKYEEILQLNHLDEEKARNLKIGDRIRIK